MKIRKNFPLLEREIDGVGITYLDSAATTLKPLCVMEAEHAYATQYTSNVHRGHSSLSEEASYQYEKARRLIAQFIQADPDTVILTPNTSYSLTMIANGLNLPPESTILCASHNHHSNLLPWMQRTKVFYIDGDPLKPLSLSDVKVAIEKYKPKLLALSWVSNVNGIINPISEICKIAREYDVISVIDAAQAAPHIPINVTTLGCNFLAFSGHKMLGSTGTGVLWGQRKILETLKPLVIAGGTVDRVTQNRFTLKKLPHRLEPGTPHISGVIGLGAAVNYLQELGHKEMEIHQSELVLAMRDSLKSLRNATVLMGCPDCPQIPIASIVPTNTNIHSDELCRILSDSFKIMTRSGFHCAHPLFDSQAFEQGAVRFSAYIYNTVEEIQRAIATLNKILDRIS